MRTDTAGEMKAIRIRSVIIRIVLSTTTDPENLRKLMTVLTVL